MAEENSTEQTQQEAAKSAAASEAYGDSQIRVLDDIEHVRTRPGMYIGPTNTRGCITWSMRLSTTRSTKHWLGSPERILVSINEDGSASVEDDGRGIPVGIHPTEKIPTVEVVFATLGAGGKFDHKEGSPYATSAGLHGVGASVVNFLSEWLEVEVSRDGKVYHMEFERGKKAYRAESHRIAPRPGRK